MFVQKQHAHTDTLTRQCGRKHLGSGCYPVTEDEEKGKEGALLLLRPLGILTPPTSPLTGPVGLPHSQPNTYKPLYSGCLGWRDMGRTDRKK